MRKPSHSTSLLALATIAVLCSACNPAGAGDQQQADEAEGSLTGFFGALLEAESQPVEVPAGTNLTVRLLDTLSSHDTAAGTSFSAEVTQEVSIDGAVVVPVGSTVHGRVTEAHAAEKIGGRPILSLAFDGLSTPDGQTIQLAASLARSGKSQVGKDAAIISGSTIGGAILGEAIHEGEGTTVGAIAGAIGGTIGALKTKGQPVVLAQGSILNISIDRAFTLNTTS